MAIENEDTHCERASVEQASDALAIARTIEERLRSGQHTALLSDGADASLWGQVLGVVGAGWAARGQRLGDVRLIVIDCGVHPQPLGSLSEAQVQVSDLLGEGRSGPAVAADRMLSGLRRRLIGDLGEPTPHLALLLALEKLGQQVSLGGSRWALVFTRVERADADSLHVLSQLVLRRLSVPLLLVFSAKPSSAPALELLHNLRSGAGPASVIERASAKTETVQVATSARLPTMPPRVLGVLRALAMAGPGCELSLLIELLGQTEDEVLASLQEAADAGIEIGDDGNDRFELGPELTQLVTAQMLPSLVRSYHRRLAALLSDRESGLQLPVGTDGTVPKASPSAATAVMPSGSAVTTVATEVAQTEPAASTDTGSPAAGDRPLITESSPDKPAVPALSSVLATQSDRTPANREVPEVAATPAAIPAEVPLFVETPSPTLHWPYAGSPGPGPGSLSATHPSSADTEPAKEVPVSPAAPLHRAPTAEVAPVAPRESAGAPSPADRQRNDRRAQSARAARHLVEAGDLDPGIERYLHAVDQALRVGAIREAMALADRAMRLLGELPESERRRALRIQALCALGRVRWLGNGPDERFTLAGALVAFQEARSLLRPQDAAELRATVVSQLAAVLYEIGDLPSLEKALTELSEASRTLLGQGEAATAARLLNDQAAVYVRIGDPVRAAHLLEESRRFFGSGRFPADDEQVALELAETEHQLARLPLHVAARQGRQLDAIALGRGHAQEAAATYKRLGMRRELAHVTETLGRLETMAGRHEAAMAYLSAAGQIERELHDILGLARTTAAMSELLLAAGQLPGAVELLSESLALNIEKGSLIGLSYVRRGVEKLAQRVQTSGTDTATSRALHRLHDDLVAAEEHLGRVNLPSDL